MLTQGEIPETLNRKGLRAVYNWPGWSSPISLQNFKVGLFDGGGDYDDDDNDVLPKPLK